MHQIHPQNSPNESFDGCHLMAMDQVLTKRRAVHKIKLADNLRMTEPVELFNHHVKVLELVMAAGFVQRKEGIEPLRLAGVAMVHHFVA